MKVSRAFFIAASIVVLSACGGGGSAPLTARNPAQPYLPPGATGTLTVEVIVPPQQTSTTSHAIHTDYFSPATQSVVITAVGPSPKTMTTTAYVNVDVRNPACTGYQSTTCNVSLGLTVSGTYTLTFTAYDHTQTKNTGPFVGRPLATNETRLAYVAGKTKTYTVALDGIPAYFTISPNGNGYLQGSRTGLTLYGSSEQQVIVVSLDRDGNPIIGPGAPSIKLTASSSALSVVALGPSNPNVFTLKAQTSGSPPIVSPGIIYLTAAAAQPATSKAGSATTTVPIRLAHSAVIVSTGSKVVELLDGNTRPSTTFTAPNVQSLATDAAGNVFIDTYKQNDSNCTITEYPGYGAAPTFSFSPAGIGAGNDSFWALAVGPSDTLYVAITSGLGIGASTNLFTYPAGGTVSISEDSLDTGNLGTGSHVAVDASGFWYVSDVHLDYGGPTGVEQYGVISTPNYSNDTGSNYPGALAVDSAGTLYAIFSPAIAEYPRGSLTYNKTLTGLASPQSLAVDVAGEVYVTDYGKGGIVRYASGQSTPTSIIPLSGASQIAVVPSSAFSF